TRRIPDAGLSNSYVVRIRTTQPSDREAIEDIVERAYTRYVERIGRRPAPMDADYAKAIANAQVHVANDAAGTILGVVVLVQAAEHVLVENVAVDPSHQGEGIGRSLLAFAEQTARDQGLPELRLYTNAAMTENLALYPRLGFTEAGRRGHRGFERV